MNRPNRHEMLRLPGALLALILLVPAAAPAALTATFQLQPQAESVAVGQPLAIDVFLRSLTDTDTVAPARVGSVDLDFGGVTNTSSPRRFVATTAAPNAFVASAGFASTLSLSIDSSLVDGHVDGFADLSYAVSFGNATGGLPTNSGVDVQVGTLYVAATQPGAYTLTANNPGTAVTANDANGTAFALTYLPAVFTATAVPEPTATAAIAALAGATLMRRRRGAAR